MRPPLPQTHRAAGHIQREQKEKLQTPWEYKVPPLRGRAHSAADPGSLAILPAASELQTARPRSRATLRSYLT